MSFLRDGYDDVDMQSSLREENLELKRKLNAQVEVTKKLNTRVQKMSEDMAKLKIRANVIPAPDRSRPGSAMSHHPTPHAAPFDPFYHAPAHPPKPHHSSGQGPTVVAARTIIHKRNPSLEALVDDLRDQLRDLAKENSGLKTKVQHYKSLHEATLRKRGKWDAIGPKVPSSRGPVGGSAKSPTKNVATSVAGSLANLYSAEKQVVNFTETAEYQDMCVNTIQNLKHAVKSKDEQLADATTQIDQLARALKIAEAKASVEPDTTEVMVLKQQVATLEARQRAMTLDATNKTRLVEELLERCTQLESTDLANRQRVTELTGQLAHVTGDLEASQTRVADLETQIAQASVDVQTMDHVRTPKSSSSPPA
ncbi:hypothetical protein BCR44DRAFT_1433783 [Catenaria anguillulae PL171]|uniref:Uncharacterized protein n=1 Tax=Catenaria anguillulae PL171 TaxID=765915 RepID=A0A1Y2HLU7_9FUNG|nr:hypothetical protein BCR44DRAFT_1433783 [Catenaria anguillulae PL171]